MVKRRAAVRSGRGLRLCVAGMVAGLAAVNLATWSSSAQSQSAAPYPPPSHIMELLVQGQFDELERIFNRSQADFEAGTRTEGAVAGLFSAFGTSDIALAAALDSWNESFPDSAVAPLARAQFNEHRGWIARGGKLYSDTAEARLARMDALFEQAQADAVVAIGRNEKQPLAFRILIGIGKAHGAPWVEEVMLKGLEAVPTSTSIRWAYLYNLTPWWGGSLDQIRSFIDQHVRTAPNQEKLRALYGFPDYVTGEIWRRGGQPAEALQYYDRALNHGEELIYLRQRARAYDSLDRYQEALADLNRILELFPDSVGMLDERAALLYWDLKDHEAAYADWERAITLDPLDPDIRYHRATALYRSKRYEDAMADVEAALELGRGDDRIHRLRGRILFYGENDYRQANDEFKLATELDPDSQNNWYFYARSLDKLIDCETVTAYRRFLAICAAGARCGEAYVSYSQDRIEALHENGKCLNK